MKKYTDKELKAMNTECLEQLEKLGNEIQLILNLHDLEIYEPEVFSKLNQMQCEIKAQININNRK